MNTWLDYFEFVISLICRQHKFLLLTAISRQADIEIPVPSICLRAKYFPFGLARKAIKTNKTTVK